MVIKTLAEKLGIVDKPQEYPMEFTAKSGDVLHKRYEDKETVLYSDNESPVKSTVIVYLNKQTRMVTEVHGPMVEFLKAVAERNSSVQVIPAQPQSTTIH